MCMQICFGQYVNNVWIPNRLRLDDIILFKDSFKDIASMFNVCRITINGKIGRFNFLEERNNEYHFFYPKRKTNIGYKIFEKTNKKSAVRGLVSNNNYITNKWYEATNESISSTRPYVSGFHIFPRILDAKGYMMINVYNKDNLFEIRKVEYDDVLHYGLETPGCVTVIANRMRILKNG